MNLNRQEEGGGTVSLGLISDPLRSCSFDLADLPVCPASFVFPVRVASLPDSMRFGIWKSIQEAKIVSTDAST